MAAVMRQLDFQSARIALRSAALMVTAGTAWGLLFAVATTALTFWNCGMTCLDEVATTSALSIAVGILTIGPIAVCGRRD